MKRELALEVKELSLDSGYSKSYPSDMPRDIVNKFDRVAKAKMSGSMDTEFENGITIFGGVSLHIDIPLSTGDCPPVGSKVKIVIEW